MLRLDDELDQVLVAKVYRAEQDHVFRFWPQLTEAERRALLDQLGGLDLQQLERMVKLIDAAPSASSGVLAPLPPVVHTPEQREALAARGWEALRQGQVACVLVAGGMGTRLGWPHPKGTFSVGPVTGKSLFQLFAEQLLALGQRAGRPLDLYLLTSPENRDETEAFLRDHGWFGLAAEQVTLLVQGELPCTDGRGKLLLSAPHRLATSPNGHGGTFLALRDSGALARMAERGQELLFTWQVDNPLCAVADPVFVGAHLEAGVEASTKVVEKTDPEERVGMLALRNGLVSVVEYTELPAELQAACDEEGRLLYRAGNIAIHLFSRAFLERLVESGFTLEPHVTRKRIPHVDVEGKLVEPSEANGVKFETFIFDLLPEAKGHLTLQVERQEEFEPLKNAEGPYSPETVRRALSDRAARWLEAAGHDVPRGADGRPTHVYEVSPTTALDPEGLRGFGLPAAQDGRLAV